MYYEHPGGPRHVPGTCQIWQAAPEALLSVPGTVPGLIYLRLCLYLINPSSPDIPGAPPTGTLAPAPATSQLGRCTQHLHLGHIAWLIFRSIIIASG